MTTHVDGMSLSTYKPSPLAMTPDQFRQITQQAATIANDYYARRSTSPVYTPPTAEILEKFHAMPLPQQGWTAEEILSFWAKDIMPYDMGNQMGTFAAWVNPAAAPISIILDHLASIMNPTSAKGLHAATEIERLVLRWVMELIGFPLQQSGGIFVNGGSLANYHGLKAALHWASIKYHWDDLNDGLQGSHPPFVLYGSQEVHSCVAKAVRALGLGLNSYRRIPVDEEDRVDLLALQRAIEADLAAGNWPFAVVASAGTVNTGRVDPLEKIADLCQRYDLWLHVDGAYGWLGVLDPRTAPLYGDGLQRANSLAADAHKWPAASNTCSFTLVRDQTMLAGAFGFEAAYLDLDKQGQSFGDGERFDQLGMYQTRHFLAAKFLGVLLQLGQTGLQEHVRRHIDLARYMTDQIHAATDMELLAGTDLTVVCFRYCPSFLRGDKQKLNQLNRMIVNSMMRGEQRAFVSGTDLVDGCYALRSCALHYNLTVQDIETILSVVRELGADCLSAEMILAGSRQKEETNICTSDNEG